MDFSKYPKGLEIVKTHKDEVARLEREADAAAERERNSEPSKLVAGLLMKFMESGKRDLLRPAHDNSVVPMHLVSELEADEPQEGSPLRAQNSWLGLKGEFPNLADQTPEQIVDSVMEAGCDLFIELRNVVGAGPYYIATISSTNAELDTMGLSVKDGVLTEDIANLAIDVIYEAAKIGDVQLGGNGL